MLRGLYVGESERVVDMSKLEDDPFLSDDSRERHRAFGSDDKPSAKPLSKVWAVALENSLAALDPARLEQRLAELESLRSARGLAFEKELRKEADKKFSRFLAHATSRARTFSAITGMWGLPGQALDLPLFYIQAFKNAAEVALLYGFDPRQPQEQALLLGLVRIGHLPSFALRKQAVDKLLAYPVHRERELLLSSVMALPARACVTKAARLLPARLRFLGPILGGVLNALNSRHLMETILDSAQIAYQLKRDRLTAMREQHPNGDDA